MSNWTYTSPDNDRVLTSVVFIALLVAGVLVLEWQSIDSLQRNAIEIARVSSVQTQ
ncbi:MAG: hypothetical protein KIT25_14895 [Enhydrobacter sp.]|nr:MAG: hypothetical protein KIT25_14895 [Enhydrobacter sp.]